MSIEKQSSANRRPSSGSATVLSDPGASSSRHGAQDGLPSYQTAIASSSAASSSSALSLPIVVPQLLSHSDLNSSYTSPFARAYAPALQSSGITQADFYRFIDGLNEAFMAPGALQGVHFVGSVVTKVPNFIPQLIGSRVSLLAGAGSASISLARTKAYIRKANRELFGPCGLRVRIKATGDMLYKVGAKPLLFESLNRYEDLSIASADQAPASLARNDVADDCKAYMVALNGFTAPLVFEAPSAAPQASKTVVDKMASWQKRQHRRQDDRDARRASKRAQRGKFNETDSLVEERRKTVRKTRWIIITRDAQAATRRQDDSTDDAADVDLADDADEMQDDSMDEDADDTKHTPASYAPEKASLPAV